MDISKLKKGLGPSAITALNPDKYFLTQYIVSGQSLRMEPEDTTIDCAALMQLGVNFELTKDAYPPDNPGEYDPDYHRRRVKDILLKNKHVRLPLNVDREEIHPIITIGNRLSVIEELVLEEVNKFRAAAGNQPLKKIPAFGSSGFKDHLEHPLVQRAVAAAFNELELERLISRKDKSKKNLDDPLEKNRHAFLSLTQQFFEGWYRENGLQVPFEKIGPLVPRMSKEDEYLDYLKRFIKEPTATPEETKKVLWDRVYWKNPARYLTRACEAVPITRAELHRIPAFSWVDEKG